MDDNSNEHNGELSGLTRAISRLQDAVDRTHDGHPSKHRRLNDLGNAFLTRFEQLGELNDLEQAIARHESAVNCIPDGHPDKHACLGSLADSLLARFNRFGSLNDLEQVMSMQRDAVDLTPHSHPDKPGRLNNLGNCFRIRFGRLGEPSDLEQAISLYSCAASSLMGPINVRFRASEMWISCARQIHDHSLLQAYSVTITLLPQLAWIGLSIADRYSVLVRGADVAREAAAAALESGLPETAVEWLEQGRSVIWDGLFQLRSSFEELSLAHPCHSRRLQELSVALENAIATREKLLSPLLEQTRGSGRDTMGSLQEVADRQRTLAIQRDTLLQEIRRFPGFDQFLLCKRFSQLRASAHSGPVVILNAAETRCDALIVLADIDHPIHIPLPNLTLNRSRELQNVLQRSSHRDDSWESVLSYLWEFVVKPVLDALVISTPGELSRIFWCPTGPLVFLPIHAAGLYQAQYSEPGHKVFDFVISSYVPTLSILTSSPDPAVSPSGDLRFLAVRQPPSDGLPPLPGVVTEMEHLRATITNSPSTRITLLESSSGTVEEVLALMKATDWVHFACHGVQDAMDSGLCLADQRRLRLADMIGLSRPRGGLAFLSAVDTAKGDERLPDEAIHVAAAMLFAGYGEVIGTTGSISDRLAPIVTKGVYEYLFLNGTRPDYREAARALHDAIGRIRGGGEVSFAEWVPFVHVGL